MQCDEVITGVILITLRYYYIFINILNSFVFFIFSFLTLILIRLLVILYIENIKWKSNNENVF